MIYVSDVTRVIYCLEISVRARYILLKHFSLSILKRKEKKKHIKERKLSVRIQDGKRHVSKNSPGLTVTLLLKRCEVTHRDIKQSRSLIGPRAHFIKKKKRNTYLAPGRAFIPAGWAP